MTITPLPLTHTIDGVVYTIHPVLIRAEAGNYLVDCGYEETAGQLIEKLREAGVEERELTGLIITHDDHDHMGGAAELKRLNGNLKIFCGAEEADSVCGKVKSERLIQAENSLDSMPDRARGWARAFIEMLRNTPKVPVDVLLGDGDEVAEGIVAVSTPGHTKGHISIYLPGSSAVITGDALVLENSRLTIANPQYALDLERANESAEKIRALDAKTIICYHGGVVGNVSLSF
jgi:glyoxylase-like metal-dependent hydrolase (beta-lactamase superfamily II)